MEYQFNMVDGRTLALKCMQWPQTSNRPEAESYSTLLSKESPEAMNTDTTSNYYN